MHYVADSATISLHIKVDREKQSELRDAAKIAFELGAVDKPELTKLMELFIGWGMDILKKKWLNRMGYK